VSTMIERRGHPTGATAAAAVDDTAPDAAHRGRGATTAICAVVAVVAVGCAVAGAVGLGAAPAVVAAVVVAAWAAAGAVIGRRAPGVPLGPLVAAASLVGGVALLASAHVDGSGTAAAVRGVAVALLPAVLFHLAVTLPDGAARGRRLVLVALGYVAAAAVAVVAVQDRPDVPGGLVAVEGLGLGAVAVITFRVSCRRATPRARARLQWAGWGVVVTVAVAVAAWALDALTGWPPRPALVALVASVLVPVGLVAGTHDRAIARVDRVLVHTIVTVGLVGLVAAVYLVVVIGLDGTPSGAARSVMALSLVAAALAAVLSLPARRRLEEFANQRIYGERRAPDEALRTFATRMSRSVPMDELLLQLVESLRKTMGLSRAEVWTGADGRLERQVSVPDAGPGAISLAGEELSVAARTHVSGNGWLAVWMPSLLAGREDRVLRVAPIAHLGELLGLIVVERTADDPAFDDDEDRVLSDLARQVGLALHNVRLDSALQASLEELQDRNEELVASRARIVSASDESRRRIERNLHDGAQQHLVAMAVKVGLARQLLEKDPAVASTMLEELRNDVQVTVGELRELAHGIYPPLLRDRGLPEALTTAANRGVLPTEVRAEGLRRYPTDLEAAVYFCCLEAMQNAGKHAGEGSTITVDVEEVDGELRFSVTDDGAGFAAGAKPQGHGFVNMEDRVGAMGGRLEVRSAPGEGTTIRGVVPVPGSDAEPAV
jgi:signal transduction histidine kinase